MRLLQDIDINEAREIEDFSKWILVVGEGKLNEPNDGVTQIQIPDDILIPEGDNPIESIIKAVYGTSFDEERDPKFFQDRAILCEEKIYRSSDSIDPSDTRADKNPVYTPDFLNKIKISGLPNHLLRLKVGCPVMLLRNLDLHGGLMNGTRLQIIRLGDKLVQGRILTGTRVGKLVIIPRMPLTPSDRRLPFKMKRRQFPLSYAFAMTINKSQGKSLDNVGIYLPKPVFSHGQLYVAMSRVKSKEGCRFLLQTVKENRKMKQQMLFSKKYSKTSNRLFLQV
ncbi:putative DNA helicase [Arabidopsis thaliana]